MFVLMADADVMIMADFSEAARQLVQPRGIAGVVATSPPWLISGRGDVDRERWQELFAAGGLPPPVFDCPHPGRGIYYAREGGMENAPAYFNFGFVLGTRDAMNAIAKTFHQDYLLAADFAPFAAQAGLTLSIIRNAIHYQTLPLRYNFWGDYRYHQAFPDEAADMRILHYLNGPFLKDRDIESPAHVAVWLEAHRDDEGSHAQFLWNAIAKAHAAVLAER